MLPECDKFNIVSGKCQTCVDPNKKVYKGQCIQRACPSGEYLYLGNCVSTNCPNWNDVLERCNDCGPGMVWSLFHCVVINPTRLPSQCQPGQTFMQGRCFDMIPNCVKINQNAQCDECSLGYRPVGGRCVGCGGPNSLNPCMTCPHNHYMNERGNCVIKDTYCATVQANGFCTSCTTGIGPFAGVCCPPNQSFRSGFCQDIVAPTTLSQTSLGGLTLLNTQKDAWKENCAIIDIPRQICK